MNRIVLTTSLALTLSCSAVFAQQTPDAQQAPTTTQGEHHHHAPDPQKQAEHLSKKLNLTPDQTAKLEPILASRDQQIQSLRANTQLTPQDRHQQMRTINEQAQQGMSGILTPDQMAQLKTMHHHGHHGQNGQGEPNQAPSA